jgi:glucose-1-phosphate cytidylyltransferase
MEVPAPASLFSTAAFSIIWTRLLNVCLKEEPLERLAEAGELMAFRHDGFFYAMDTYREYSYLNDLWNSNEAPWHIWSDANGG